MEEGTTAEVCITASGSIPDNYDVDFSVVSFDGLAVSSQGKYIRVRCTVDLYVLKIKHEQTVFGISMAIL